MGAKIDEMLLPGLVTNGIQAFHEGSRSQQVALAGRMLYADEMLTRSMTSLGASREEIQAVMQLTQKLGQTRAAMFQLLRESGAPITQDIANYLQETLLVDLGMELVSPAEAKDKMLELLPELASDESFAEKLESSFSDVQAASVSQWNLIESISQRLQEVHKSEPEPEIIEL